MSKLIKEIVILYCAEFNRIVATGKSFLFKLKVRRLRTIIKNTFFYYLQRLEIVTLIREVIFRVKTRMLEAIAVRR